MPPRLQSEYETYGRNGLQAQGLCIGPDQGASSGPSGGWKHIKWSDANGGVLQRNAIDSWPSSTSPKSNNYVFPPTPIRPRHPIFRFPSGQPLYPPFPMPPIQPPNRQPFAPTKPPPSLPPIKPTPAAVPLPPAVKSNEDQPQSDDCDTCEAIMLPYSGIYYPFGIQGPALCCCPYVPLMNGCGNNTVDERIC